jgi:phosphopentomutase
MRVAILILDSLGIGAAPDAAAFGDVGANTLGSIAVECLAGRADGRYYENENQPRSGALHIPNLEKMGLGLASQLATGQPVAGLSAQPAVMAAYGAAYEVSSGKDTPSGHWELMGVPVRFDWGYFPKKTDSFPPELLDTLVKRAGLPGWLGNCHASGTEIIARLGEEHQATGKPIFYTSADSVFQIAVHEDSFGLDNLYRLCEIAYEEVQKYQICRVIARPFIGSNAANYKRTGNRHDYAVQPPAPTLLDKVALAGGQVVSVGKISDIFAGSGITQAHKATGHKALWDATLSAWATLPDNSLVMTNFVEFDQSFGHRRNVAGYAAALEEFDARLPDMFAALGPDDVWILSADHGCDPTWPGTEHTREHVPVLVAGASVAVGSLGVRHGFADVGQSLAHRWGLSPFADGVSFL